MCRCKSDRKKRHKFTFCQRNIGIYFFVKIIMFNFASIYKKRQTLSIKQYNNKLFDEKITFICIAPVDGNNSVQCSVV